MTKTFTITYSPAGTFVDGHEIPAATVSKALYCAPGAVHWGPDYAPNNLSIGDSGLAHCFIERTFYSFPAEWLDEYGEHTQS